MQSSNPFKLQGYWAERFNKANPQLVAAEAEAQRVAAEAQRVADIVFTPNKKPKPARTPSICEQIDEHCQPIDVCDKPSDKVTVYFQRNTVLLEVNVTRIVDLDNLKEELSRELKLEIPDSVHLTCNKMKLENHHVLDAGDRLDFTGHGRGGGRDFSIVWFPSDTHIAAPILLKEEDYEGPSKAMYVACMAFVSKTKNKKKTIILAEWVKTGFQVEGNQVDYYGYFDDPKKQWTCEVVNGQVGNICDEEGKPVHVVHFHQIDKILNVNNDCAEVSLEQSGITIPMQLHCLRTPGFFHVNGDPESDYSYIDFDGEKTGERSEEVYTRLQQQLVRLDSLASKSIDSEASKFILIQISQNDSSDARYNCVYRTKNGRTKKKQSFLESEIEKKFGQAGVNSLEAFKEKQQGAHKKHTAKKLIASPKPRLRAIITKIEAHEQDPHKFTVWYGVEDQRELEMSIVVTSTDGNVDLPLLVDYVWDDNSRKKFREFWTQHQSGEKKNPNIPEEQTDGLKSSHPIVLSDSDTEEPQKPPAVPHSKEDSDNSDGAAGEEEAMKSNDEYVPPNPYNPEPVAITHSPSGSDNGQGTRAFVDTLLGGPGHLVCEKRPDSPSRSPTPVTTYFDRTPISDEPDGDQSPLGRRTPVGDMDDFGPASEPNSRLASPQSQLAFDEDSCSALNGETFPGVIRSETILGVVHDPTDFAAQYNQLTENESIAHMVLQVELRDMDGNKYTHYVPMTEIVTNFDEQSICTVYRWLRTVASPQTKAIDEFEAYVELVRGFQNFQPDSELHDSKVNGDQYISDPEDDDGDNATALDDMSSTQLEQILAETQKEKQAQMQRITDEYGGKIHLLTNVLRKRKDRKKFDAQKKFKKSIHEALEREHSNKITDMKKRYEKRQQKLAATKIQALLRGASDRQLCQQLARKAALSRLANQRRQEAEEAERQAKRLRQEADEADEALRNL